LKQNNINYIKKIAEKWEQDYKIAITDKSEREKLVSTLQVELMAERERNTNLDTNYKNVKNKLFEIEHIHEKKNIKIDQITIEREHILKEMQTRTDNLQQENQNMKQQIEKTAELERKLELVTNEKQILATKLTLEIKQLEDNKIVIQKSLNVQNNTVSQLQEINSKFADENKKQHQLLEEKEKKITKLQIENQSLEYENKN